MTARKRAEEKKKSLNQRILNNNCGINELHKRFTLKNGKLISKVDFRNWKRGAEIGYNAHGYLKVGVLGKPRFVHRVIWAMHYGAWPTQHLDHINGDRKDNRIENLRLATYSDNASNQRFHRNGGIRGVTWDKKARKWRMMILRFQDNEKICKKDVFFGYARTKKSAIERLGWALAGIKSIRKRNEAGEKNYAD